MKEDEEFTPRKYDGEPSEYSFDRIIFPPRTMASSRVSFPLLDLEDHDRQRAMRMQSTSVFQPRTLEGYSPYLKPMHLEGFLDKQSNEDRNLWYSVWSVMKEGTLYFYDPAAVLQDNDKEESLDDDWCTGYIRLDQVISVKTEKDYGNSAFQVKCEGRSHVFRAATKDQMHNWLFEFQRSTASIISLILRGKRKDKIHRSMSFDCPDIGYPKMDPSVEEARANLEEMRSSVDALDIESVVSTPEKTREFSMMTHTQEVLLSCNHPPLVHSSSPEKKYIPPHQRKTVSRRPSLEDSSISCSLFFDTSDMISTLRESETSSGSHDTQFLLNLDDEETSSCNTLVYTSLDRMVPSIYGVTALQGIRETMEDTHTCISDFNKFLSIDFPEKQSFYAIYDGHSGSKAAQFLKETLATYIGKHPQFLTDIKGATLDSFRRIDKEFLERAVEEGIYDGSTAVVVLRRGSKLVTVNLGDSRAVVCVNGIAQDITITQTPGRADERLRIEEAGGWITEEKELHMSKLHQMDLADPLIRQKAKEVVRWLTVYRVNGELAVSRAIGDPDYKGEGLSKYMWCFPPKHNQKFHQDLVIPDPEFLEIEITSHSRFIIIACDGLWDVLSSQEAVEEVLTILNRGGTAQESSESLAHLAVRLGSSDNISVIVVLLEQVHYRN